MKICLYRGGGYGDVICLTSAIPGLQQKYPDATIDFAAVALDLAKLNPRVNQTILGRPNPEDYDLFLEPDHGPEWNDWICKVQCRMIGVPFHPPEIYLAKPELDAADQYDVAIQHWTAPERRYDVENMRLVVNRLQANGLKVVHLDNGPDDIGAYRPRDLTMRAAAALASKARIVLTVDTAMMHVCAALQLKSVTIFGNLTSPVNQYIPNTICARTSWPPEGIYEAIIHRMYDLVLPIGTILTDEKGYAQCVE